MIYQEVEHCYKWDTRPVKDWYSYCKDNLGKKYNQCLVPCRILGITPSEYIKLLIVDYNCIVTYNPEKGTWGRKWHSREDESRWRNFINKTARQKGFHI